MNKINKKLSIIIICLLAVTFGLIYNKPNVTSILNDSGFDSSYGGSHSRSGSSRSKTRSSSYRSSSSKSGSSTHNSSEGNVLVALMLLGTMGSILVISFIIVIITASSRKKYRNNIGLLNVNRSASLSKEQFESIIHNITLEDFLFERTSDLVQIQYNWMNFDYDKLREKLTDELYNQYEMQLKTLSMKGQKNVMKEFNPIESIVTNVTEDNGKYTVTMELVISFIDYIEENNKVVRGNSSTPITMYYELVFTSSSNGFIDECPNCGSKLNDTTTQVCPYCRSQITQNSTKWVLSKKIAKGQR